MKQKDIKRILEENTLVMKTIVAITESNKENKKLPKGGYTLNVERMKLTDDNKDIDVEISVFDKKGDYHSSIIGEVDKAEVQRLINSKEDRELIESRINEI